MHPKPKNIVFILADDLAIWALGCYGNSEIHTPNIDAMATEGLRFTEFYCTSPVCSPARASLLTGKIPSSHGVHDWIRGGNGVNDAPIDYLADHRTYTEVLAEHGYACGISGKWHLGNSPTPQKGYAHWFVYPSGGGTYKDVVMHGSGGRVQTTGYVTDVIADDALEFIQRQAAQDAPFYLNVNFTAPHSPWVDQHPQGLVDLYADCPFTSCPQETRHPWIKQHPIELQHTDQHASPERKTVTVRDHLQGYFAAVTAMDACVGKLREMLRTLGLERDTLVVFTSDNGFNCGHHGIWGKGNATFPQNMYDNSVKVPLIIAQPGNIEAGGICDDMLSGYDVMPTILDVVGLEAEVPAGLPGRSFRHALEGRVDPNGNRSVVVYDEFGPTRMIRTRHWKYVHRYPYGPHELFDLVNDPGERINLLKDERVLSAAEDDRQARAASMWFELERWFERYADPGVDGRLQPVTGRGQIARVGKPGAQSFYQLEVIRARTP